jgi:hypothetical protein
VGVKGWEVVYRGERLHADLLAAALESRGIRVEVFGDHAYSYAINFTEAQVLVPEDQAHAALKLIQQAEAKRGVAPKPRTPPAPRKPATPRKPRNRKPTPEPAATEQSSPPAPPAAPEV